jgi:hypothetical protein
MDTVEKELIKFIHSSNENLENVNYCNELTSELLQVIKLEHKGFDFKENTYKNRHTLHINMAKYYVKAFQVFYAIKNLEKIVSILHVDVDPKKTEEVDKDRDIAYKCIDHIEKIKDISKLLDAILMKIMDDKTFLPSLEEMDKIVIETKTLIQKTEIVVLFKNFELFLEKKKFNEFTKLFSNV